MLNKKLVDPKNTAVVVIDIQNDYCSEKGKIAKVRKFDMGPIHRIIPDISQFLDKARNKSVPIIWTRMIEDPDYMKPNAAYKILSSPAPLALCTPGSFGFEYYKIKPEKGDFEIVKKSYDAFTNKKLHALLKRKSIKNLIVLGVYTAVCVDSTIRSAYALGYNVIVPSDLVAMPKERWDLHKAALKNLDMIFAHVLKSREIVELWKYNYVK